MSRLTQIKIALVVALIADALLSRPDWSQRFTIPLVAFGLFNVLFPSPGTEWVRGLSIAGTLAALALPQWFFGPVATIALFTWLPAYAVAWALSRDPRD